MTATPVPRDDCPGETPFPGEALLEEMESIPEPTLLYLTGGRIAAVNRAAARLADFPVVGMTIGELLERYGALRPDGSRVLRGDLPYARALRGEIVDQGERIAMNLPDGSVYQALVTSTPVIADGKVVASLSIWHDFGAYVRGIGSPAGPRGDPPEER